MAKRTSKKECARRKAEVFKIWQRVRRELPDRGMATGIQQIYQKEAGIIIPRTTIAGWIREFDKGWKPGGETPLAPVQVNQLHLSPSTIDNLAETIMNKMVEFIRARLPEIVETLPEIKKLMKANQDTWWTKFKRTWGL